MAKRNINGVITYVLDENSGKGGKTAATIHIQKVDRKSFAVNQIIVGISMVDHTHMLVARKRVTLSVPGIKRIL